MYDRDQRRIASFAQSSADNMADVVLFVYLTIQQPLARVPEDMAAVKAKGADASCIWGFKRDAFEWLQENKAEMYRAAMAIYDGHANPEIAQHELVAYFASLPGLGLVKGGFVVQLCFGLSGCLDTHNIVRFGLRAEEFRAARFKNAKRPETRNRLVRIYHELVEHAGGTRQLWNDWCEYVADNQPGLYAGAEHVSAIHCEALGLSRC